MQVALLQRSIGNAATARLLDSARTAPARAPGLAVQRLHEGEDATGTDEDMETLGYDAITAAVGDKRLKYKNVELQPNGALFIELRQTNAESDNVGSQMENSYDEKL